MVRPEKGNEEPVHNSKGYKRRLLIPQLGLEQAYEDLYCMFTAFHTSQPAGLRK